jgi:hypothetical protein
VASRRRVKKETKEDIELCINSRCEFRRWVDSDDGGDEFGGPLVLENDLVIGSVHERLRSIGLVVPARGSHYDFKGDIDGILRRICRRR